MFELILLWAYILIINWILGCLTLEIADRLLLFTLKDNSRVLKSHSFMGIQLAGVTFITVFSEIWSIFGRVYTAAHLTLLVIAAIYLFTSFFPKRKDHHLLSRAGFPGRIIHTLFSWEGVLYLIIVVATAYFASRGEQHTDTFIYHAEMIRWYEEYGCVIGMGNLQNHFAYNSAGFAYAAIFSMRWLMGQSLHGTNGFFQALMVVWSLRGLIRFKDHEKHMADACRIATIIYAVVNSEYICSPASDFSALYLTLWIITLWFENSSRQTETEQTTQEKVKQPVEHGIILQMEIIHTYALLCVAACLAASYKLAVGMLVIAVAYPAYFLIKNKCYRQIFLYIGLGIAVLIPWIVRNVIISGCLVYPILMFRLPGLDWTIPAEVLAEDSAQISTWGKCLFDKTLADTPVSGWLPVWWDDKDTYEKMLIVSNIAALFGEMIWIVRKIVLFIKEKRTGWAEASLKFAIVVCMTVWFMQAPFIRYGLAFLLVFPLMEIAQWIWPGDGHIKKEHGENGTVTLYSIFAGFLCTAIILSLSIYINYYTLYDVVMAKSELKEPYYLLQKDYVSCEYLTTDMDGMTVYYPADGENNSYAPIPSTAYLSMAENTKLRGETLEDGFMPR